MDAPASLGHRAASPHRVLASTIRLAILLVLVIHGLRVWAVGLPPPEEMGDFAVLWIAANAERTGLNPYDNAVLDSAANSLGVSVYYGPFNYPPVVLSLLAPLADLPFEESTRLWMAILIVLSAVSAVLLIAALPVSPHQGFARLLAAIGFVAYFPVYWNLIFGNVNTVILFLLAAAWASCRITPLKGLANGAALAIKIMPALVVGARAVWVQEWRLIAAITLAAVVSTVLGAVLIGPDLTVTFLTSRLPRFVAGDYANPLFYPFNQSLGGLSHRLFSGGGELASWMSSPVIAQIVHLMAAALVLGISLRVWRRTRRAKDHGLGDAMAIVLAVVLPSYSHGYYAIWLLPAYAALLGWITRQPSSRLAWGIAGMTFLSFVLTGFIYDYDSPLFHSGPLLLLTSLPTFGLLLLWAALGVALWHTPDEGLTRPEGGSTP